MTELKGIYCGRCGGVWKKSCICEFPKFGFPMVMVVKPNTVPETEPDNNQEYIGMGYRNPRA